MYDLQENEKITSVMVYTDDAFYHGKIISRDIVRVEILLRTEGAPLYLHLFEAQMIRPGSAIKTKNFSELFIPVKAIICFHTAPDVKVELDYDEYEENRRLVPVTIAISSFLLDSKIRISTQTELTQSLEVTRSTWLTLYDATITNPYLAQMNIQIPMLLVRPEKATVGIE